MLLIGKILPQGIKKLTPVAKQLLGIAINAMKVVAM